MVAIGGGVDAGQTLAAFHKVQERLPAKVRGSLVVRVVQKFAGGAVEEDRIILSSDFRA